MAVLAGNNVNINGHIQHQLTRSLERILEEANQSGELRLSNRKLKDFPKASAKYNLSDTVTADLSKNKFSELPDEVSSFTFLERLHCYHNSIRYIPDTISSLQCLSFLDLSRNQLTTLPREICQLPLQILLVSNNRLMCLPDELCRMTRLTELDASCNQLTHLPPRMSDLRQLQSLVLRNNLLLCVPIELTYLSLVRLELSSNRIGTLPVELRAMTTLIHFNVEDNPLTSPPASLCKRGMVHIFKYLEMEAAKLDKKTGGLVGSGTLGRKSRRSGASSSPGPPAAQLTERWKKRQNVDSGYCTSNDDKRWSEEIVCDVEKSWQAVNGNHSTSQASTPENTMSKCRSEMENGNNENYVESTNQNGTEEKQRPLQQIQTYREYKEALKQQRAQDVPSIYRTKDPTDDQPAYKTEPNTPTHRPTVTTTPQMATSKSDPTPLNSALLSVFDDKYVKPRSPTKGDTDIMGHDNVPLGSNGKHAVRSGGSPRGVFLNRGKVVNGVRNGRGGVNWGKEVPVEKMSFTMRREIDKAKEETDLINRLRNIIETRLKMALPEDLAPALTDGVVLCHLANHIKPRSVASIHVPSPAVPKLTMARCRRNVDNFIEACRKIGVDEGRLCSSVDVTEALQPDGRGLPRLLDTLEALVEFEGRGRPQTSPATTSTDTRRMRDATVSLLLLGGFVLTVVLLAAFPPPD